jgi:pimeloyl-ACP methyl ester carboxylesterase
MQVPALDASVSVLHGGEGSPVIVLHRDTGRVGWTQFHDALAKQHRVFAPAMPGFDQSPRLDWLRSVSHLAIVVGALLDGLAIDKPAVVGLGFGAWVAAELGVASPGAVSALVLATPMGLKPESGVVLDQFLFAPDDYVRRGFTNQAAFDGSFLDFDMDQVRLWDSNRETTMRLAWKPNMYNPELAHLLGRLTVPTLVIKAARDEIVPASVAEGYARHIPKAQLQTMPEAGHQADLELPLELADLTLSFLREAIGLESISRST